MSGTLPLGEFLRYFSKDHKQEHYESDLMSTGILRIRINYTHAHYLLHIFFEIIHNTVFYSETKFIIFYVILQILTKMINVMNFFQNQHSLQVFLFLYKKYIFCSLLLFTFFCFFRSGIHCNH